MIINVQYTGLDYWPYKGHNVILVKSMDDAVALYAVLLKQDSYWEGKNGLIKVIPDRVTSMRVLDDMCEWTGKIDIYDVAQVRKDSGVDFIIHNVVYEY